MANQVRDFPPAIIEFLFADLDRDAVERDTRQPFVVGEQIAQRRVELHWWIVRVHVSLESLVR